ncbi:MAG: RRXRR domain-containing protein [Candidatus Thermoplasmatota archaeon]|nr:RRXRR domain-containing protein [Candidatus Thermoplasmatota archaeon]
MQVFILNMDGKPLMPCKPAKARKRSGEMDRRGNT